MRLSLKEKPHEVAQRHHSRQEIRDTWAEDDFFSNAFTSGVTNSDWSNPCRIRKWFPSP
jgi:hypothetical protein